MNFGSGMQPQHDPHRPHRRSHHRPHYRQHFAHAAGASNPFSEEKFVRELQRIIIEMFEKFFGIKPDLGASPEHPDGCDGKYNDKTAKAFHKFHPPDRKKMIEEARKRKEATAAFDADAEVSGRPVPAKDGAVLPTGNPDEQSPDERRAANAHLFEKAGSNVQVSVDGKPTNVTWAASVKGGRTVNELRVRDPKSGDTFIAGPDHQNVEILSPSGDRYELVKGQVTGGRPGMQDAPTADDFKRGAQVMSEVMHNDKYKTIARAYDTGMPSLPPIALEGAQFKIFGDKADMSAASFLERQKSAAFAFRI
jgi:hypothetical protein